MSCAPAVGFLWHLFDETLSTKELYRFKLTELNQHKNILLVKIPWNWNKNNVWSLKRDTSSIAPFSMLTQKERTKITVPLIFPALFLSLDSLPYKLFSLLNKHFCILFILALRLGKHNYKFCSFWCSIVHIPLGAIPWACCCLKTVLYNFTISTSKNYE